MGAGGPSAAPWWGEGKQAAQLIVLRYRSFPPRPGVARCGRVVELRGQTRPSSWLVWEGHPLGVPESHALRKRGVVVGGVAAAADGAGISAASADEGGVRTQKILQPPFSQLHIVNTPSASLFGVLYTASKSVSGLKRFCRPKALGSAFIAAAGGTLRYCQHLHQPKHQHENLVVHAQGGVLAPAQLVALQGAERNSCKWRSTCAGG